MALEILKSSRKAGVRTDKVDPEPYFNRWEACVPLASKDQIELIGQPCYKHKTCGHLTKVAHDRIPPVVCPWCQVNTKTEELQNEILKKHGVEVFDAPQEIINLKPETFTNKMARFLRK